MLQKCVFTKLESDWLIKSDRQLGLNSSSFCAFAGGMARNVTIMSL